LVEKGWFHSRDEVFQEAIRRFLDTHQHELMELIPSKKTAPVLGGKSAPV